MTESKADNILFFYLIGIVLMIFTYIVIPFCFRIF